MEPAFVNGMFVPVQVGQTTTTPVTRAKNASSVTMSVDAKQKNFQSFGKIMVDYTKGKRPYEYLRKGTPSKLLDYPINPSWGGLYPITTCTKLPGIGGVMAKADEFIAKSIYMTEKSKGAPNGVYNQKCIDGVSSGEAEKLRGYDRTMAFKECQKPINERLAKWSADRVERFAMGNNQTYMDFYTMPMMSKVAVDFTKPSGPATRAKTPAEFMGSTSTAPSLDYPISPAFAGVYSISTCDKNPGIKGVLAKADEYISKSVVAAQKSKACEFGVYNTRCTEGTVSGEAELKRVFNRTAAFRESQKPVIERIRKVYDDRKTMFVMNDGVSYMDGYTTPLTSKVGVAAYSEGNATCARYATPEPGCESMMYTQYVVEAKSSGAKGGVFTCNDGGVTKGMAEAMRAASVSSQYRTQQKSSLEKTRFMYDSVKDAVKFNNLTGDEEDMIRKFPSAASAKITNY